ncbi:HlyD family efflux transporter periplasmic adaptor subunit [Chiayiivirga flava]|uniref:Multidrug resistance efflux pump n=1 Tax=Chiayiivirga flava TaxID=659595 RepID=A0A7W8D4T8_9GAMM|nr:multidrug resistance efflux pump [Chiayiivirga flava]
MRCALLACAVALLFAGAARAQTAGDTLRLDGEVFARRSAQIAPPSIDDLWQLNITQLAGDGAPVKAGDMVVVFDGGETQQRLVEKQSALAEKRSEREKLLLELAERERTERLATAEQLSKRDKAQRKASQPEDAIARVAYRKLVIERREAERLAELAQRRERLAAEQRRQELRLVDAQLQQIQTEVETLQSAIASLTVTAPRDGVMMHRSSWNGEKFAVGSQVFRGQSVAEIPDLASLAVRATLPERDLRKLAPGAAVRVTTEGGAGAALDGRVAEIGRIVRSRSRVQPVPVIDVVIELDGDTGKLKPGQSVRVQVRAPAKEAA